MSDLSKELKEYADTVSGHDCYDYDIEKVETLLQCAADEIERLEFKVKNLETEIRPLRNLDAEIRSSH